MGRPRTLGQTLFANIDRLVHEASHQLFYIHFADNCSLFLSEEDDSPSQENVQFLALRCMSAVSWTAKGPHPS